MQSPTRYVRAPVWARAGVQCGWGRGIKDELQEVAPVAPADLFIIIKPNQGRALQSSVRVRIPIGMLQIVPPIALGSATLSHGMLWLLGTI